MKFNKILCIISLYFSLFKTEQGNPNPVEWLNQIIFVLCSFVLIYLLCELGQKVTDRFGVFHTELYQCHWYCFSIEIQRMLAIFLLDTQQPVFIHSSGDILCTREVFKKVILKQKRSRKMNIFEFCFSFYFADNQRWILLFYDASTNQQICKCYPNHVKRWNVERTNNKNVSFWI